MNENRKQKITVLNDDFKRALEQCQCIAEECDLYTILGKSTVADWCLCAAYIDWFLTTDLKYKEIVFGDYSLIILRTLEEFVDKWRKEESVEGVSVDIKNFDQLLTLLSLMRWDSLHVDLGEFSVDGKGRLERQINARISKND